MQLERQMFALVMLGVLLSTTPVSSQRGATSGEWRSYAGDLYGTKYSPLDQISDENFSEIEIAWEWQSADTLLPYQGELGIVSQ